MTYIVCLLWICIIFQMGEKESQPQNMFIVIQQASGRSDIRNNYLFLLDHTVCIGWLFGKAEDLDKPAFSVLLVLYMLPCAWMEILKIPHLAFSLQKRFCTSLRLLIQDFHPHGFSYRIMESESKYLLSKNLGIFLKYAAEIPTHLPVILFQCSWELLSAFRKDWDCLFNDIKRLKASDSKRFPHWYSRSKKIHVPLEGWGKRNFPSYFKKNPVSLGREKKTKQITLLNCHFNQWAGFNLKQLSMPVKGEYFLLCRCKWRWKKQGRKDSP